MKRRDCVLALVAALALGGCALPPPPPPPHHAQHAPDDPPPPQRRGPPPEFVEVCRAQTEGSSVQLRGRRGETLEGRCERDGDGQLAFRPTRQP